MPRSTAAEAGTKCCKFIQQAILWRGSPAGGSRGDLFPKWLCPAEAALSRAAGRAGPGLRAGAPPRPGRKGCKGSGDARKGDARKRAEGGGEAC